MNILSEVLQATHRLTPHILQTPLLRSHVLSSLVAEPSGGGVWLKLENEQVTGSFKARGGLNKLLSLNLQRRTRGAITASSGNHGLGFARALHLTDMNGVIVLPRTASPAKVEAIRQYGVGNSIELEFVEGDSLAAELHAKRLSEENGMIWVSPYNDPQVIGGQGTIGVEIASQLALEQKSIDIALVTVGGGGLVSGIGTYLKALNPTTRIIGCLPELSPEMALWVRSGNYATVEYQQTFSDASAGAPERDSITYELCKSVVDEFCLIPEDEIASAMRLVLEHHHKVIEGSAGVAVAAFLRLVRQEPERFRGQNVVIILCGGNVTLDVLRRIL